MKIELAATGDGVTQALRDSVAQRLLLALSRFGRGVARVTVRLSDVANPLGGFDRRCEMRAWLRPGGSVAVETVNGASAVGRAAVRLAARVEWALTDGAADLAPPRAPGWWEPGRQGGHAHRAPARRRRTRRTPRADRRTGGSAGSASAAAAVEKG